MKIKKIFKISLIVILCLLVFFLTYVAFYVHSCIKSVNNIELNLNETKYTSVFINSNGNRSEMINDISNDIEIKDLNPQTIQAFVSIEDKDFFKHKGINLKRIIKAGLVNIRNGNFVEGGSTITQQLIKNKYLSGEKTIERIDNQR